MNGNVGRLPGVSGPAGALDVKTLALPPLGSTRKRARILRLFREEAPLKIPGLPAVRAWLLAED